MIFHGFLMVFGMFRIKPPSFPIQKSSKIHIFHDFPSFFGMFRRHPPSFPSQKIHGTFRSMSSSTTSGVPA
jgi:hypothetical protein